MDAIILKYLHATILAGHSCDEVDIHDIKEAQKLKDLADMVVSICRETEYDKCDFKIVDNILEIRILSADAVYINGDKSEFYNLIQIADSVVFMEEGENLLTVFKISKFW